MSTLHYSFLFFLERVLGLVNDDTTKSMERKSDLLAPEHEFSGKFWWKLMRNTCSHGHISQYWLSWTTYQMKSCPGMQSALPEALFLSGIQFFNPRNNHDLSKLKIPDRVSHFKHVLKVWVKRKTNNPSAALPSSVTLFKYSFQAAKKKTNTFKRSGWLPALPKVRHSLFCCHISLKMRGLLAWDQWGTH